MNQNGIVPRGNATLQALVSKYHSRRSNGRNIVVIYRCNPLFTATQSTETARGARQASHSKQWRQQFSTPPLEVSTCGMFGHTNNSEKRRYSCACPAILCLPYSHSQIFPHREVRRTVFLYLEGPLRIASCRTAVGRIVVGRRSRRRSCRGLRSILRSLLRGRRECLRFGRLFRGSCALAKEVVEDVLVVGVVVGKHVDVRTTGRVQDARYLVPVACFLQLFPKGALPS